jgi:hypothetical protein
MKAQVTKKQIRENFYSILSIGYCDAQYLLYFKNPFAYSSGVNGWSCDYFQIDNICISTGYAPIGTPVNYSLLRELEGKATKIVHDYNLSSSDKEKQLNELIKELMDSVLKEN